VVRTGTGAAPVIAKLAREMGALTVGVITKPFGFEGKKRMRQAESGIKELRDCVDSLITIPNQKLLTLAGETLTLIETFKRADEVLLNAVQGISDLINNTGLINADFADVSTVMKNKGLALMGTGIAEGSDRAIKAATAAISSPLLEDVSIDGATGIIINITGSSSLSIQEANEAMTLIMEAADEDAEIIFGTVIDENMNDEIKVTVIATGLTSKADEVQFVEPLKMQTNIQSQELANKFAATTMPSWDSKIENPFETPMTEVKTPVVNNNPVGRNIHEAATRYEQQKTQVAHSPFTSTAESNPVVKEENWEMSPKTKSIAEKLGFMNFEDDQFDKPSFMRKDKNSINTDL
jgi:cell division protein FtsZ